MEFFHIRNVDIESGNVFLKKAMTGVRELEAKKEKSEETLSRTNHEKLTKKA